jgi:glycosyltransferase involved in cell wall biosynthesis
MKIGIDGRLWGETGVGRYIRNLVTELSVIDKTNEYVLFVRKRDYENIKFQISNFKFQIKIADVRWHTIDEQIRLPNILSSENLDLVHFPYFSVPIAYKKPYVITIHDLIINHFPTGKASTLPFPLYSLKRLGYKLIVAHALRDAKKIIVPSNSVRDDLLATYKIAEEKIAVTHEGVEEVLSSKYKVFREKEKYTKYFLYVGNAYPHKNLERLIEAFGMLCDSSPKVQNDDVKLVLVGKDDYFYQKLSEKLKRRSIKNIVIINNVNDEELASFYQGALALVAPSLMEGFGLPVLEAMANKCLVAASDIPSFREVAGEAAVYFDPYSISDIKNNLVKVTGMDKIQKEKHIKAGGERVKLFSWRKMAEETLEIYESCNLAHSASSGRASSV